MGLDDGDHDAGDKSQDDERQSREVAEEDHALGRRQRAAEADAGALARGVVVGQHQVQQDHEVDRYAPQQAQGDGIRKEVASCHTPTVAHAATIGIRVATQLVTGGR